MSKVKVNSSVVLTTVTGIYLVEMTLLWHVKPLWYMSLCVDDMVPSMDTHHYSVTC